jgi:hypothetical protein
MEAASVMNMIMEIRENLTMEVRSNSRGSEYLEAVIKGSDLELLQSIITKHLGSAAKGPGEEVNFSGEVKKVVDSLGGLRIGQSFFCRLEDNRVVFAALWPWQYDPERITLKAGGYLLNK